MIRILSIVLVIWATLSFKAQSDCSFYLQDFIENQADTVENVGLFVKGSIKDATQFCEENQGLYRGSVKGWRYIRIPGNKTKKLVNDKRFSVINYRPYKGVALNDTMRVNNRIESIHQGAVYDSSYTGKGVIVGFIDTGIDFLHPDFRTLDDKTRVLRIWDQTMGNHATLTPSQYGYGRHWDSIQINAGLSNHTDPWGHGTTVSGTAAGNANANGTHRGVAPDSYIIAVESNFSAANWLSTVVDATEYIYAYADSNDMPCVINASVGTYLGSHDGLDPYALFIDSLVNQKSGRLFVSAAGNSGNWDKYHVQLSQINDTAFAWFEYNPSGFGGGSCLWEIWADSADFNNLQYRIGADKFSPSHEVRGYSNFNNVQNQLNTIWIDSVKNSNGDLLSQVQIWAEPRDGQYLLQVYLPQPDSSQYTFRFETVGTGKYDIWSRENYGMSRILDEVPLSVLPQNTLKLSLADSLQSITSSFQCSPNIIAVGNYVNDSGYVNKFNNWIPNTPGRGVLFYSSSKGPSRLGNVKPEVCASGHNTLSAAPLVRINDWVANGIDSVLAYGGMHMRNGGTSMASPVVAGLGALFLERCPNMTQSQFKQAIINNTYTDAFTDANLPNNAWGYGKLDGKAALESTLFELDLDSEIIYCTGDSALIVLGDSLNDIAWSNGWAMDSLYSFEDTLSVSARNLLGCHSDTLVVSIMEHTRPLINQITSPYYHCENDSVFVGITGMDIQTVLWEDGNTDLNRFLSGSQLLAVNAYDSVGCESDTAFIQIVENMNPIANANIVMDSIIGDPGFVNYLWTSNGDTVYSGIDSFITVDENGNYELIVTDVNGCQSSPTIVDYQFASILLEDNNLRIYPNPSKDFVFVELNQTFSYLLFDSQGKVVSSGVTSPINLKNLSNGTYLLSISTKNKKIVQKIVVNR